MGIRNVAKDLYRLQKEVEKLEKELEESPPEKKRQLEGKLAQARKERDKLKEILEGAKQPPSYRKPL